MNYFGGQKAKIGDVVVLDDKKGVVVCCLDDDEYSKGFSKSEWEYLKKGMIIDFENTGLIHYEVLEDDIKLVERKSTD